MRKLVALALCACGTSPTGPDLPQVTPKQAGYSSAMLADATAYAGTIHAVAGEVIVGGKVMWTWGDTTAKLDVHSIRKSFVDSLYGNAGFDLSTTLAQLGIDDVAPSLTDTEKTATIEDLLEARSGVYHVALGETPSEVAQRPARGSHPPGTFWYYNNWDFNTLGVIYNQLANADLFARFDDQIAQPIGMQDFTLDDTRYQADPSVSDMPYYDFKMSTRDMARFGLLYLQHGAWDGAQVVPADWVAQSTQAYSQTTRAGEGYGYLWWVDETGTGLFNVVDLGAGAFAAEGYGGHYVVAIPSRDMVVVSRADDAYFNADPDHRNIGPNYMGTLLDKILTAGS